jgi:hypothetical protein
LGNGTQENEGDNYMEKTLEGISLVTGRITSSSLWKGLGWGVIGGLAGTGIMDLVLMGALSALGLPALTCFSIVGNTVAQFFSVQGAQMAYTIRLGVATHYIIGPLIGAIYGMLAARLKALRVNTLKKSILLAILYIEILSQPMLAMTPILLKMTVPATLQWYAGSFVMHLLAGAALGAVVGRGLRLAK